MKILTVLRDAFFEPLQHAGLLLTFFGLSFGLMGFGIISMVLLYSLVTTSQANFMQYLLTLLAFQSFIMSPLVYYFYRCHDSAAFRCGLVVILILGLIGVIIFKPTGWVLGLFTGMLFGALFPSHHCAMLANTTDENRGQQVSFSQALSTLFSVVSAILGGYFLMQDMFDQAIFAGSAFMILGIVMILFASPYLPRQGFGAYRTEITESLKHKKLISVCLRFGSYDSVMWLGSSIAAVAGFSVLATTSVDVAKALLIFCLAPIIGQMIKKEKGHEMVLGHALLIAGWLFIIVTPKTPLFYTLGTLITGFAYQAIIPSLQSGWYKLKMPGAVMVKEASLGVTRVIFILIASMILPYGLNVLFGFMLLVVGVSLACELKTKN